MTDQWRFTTQTHRKSLKLRFLVKPPGETRPGELDQLRIVTENLGTIDFVGVASTRRASAICHSHHTLTDLALLMLFMEKIASEFYWLSRDGWRWCHCLSLGEDDARWPNGKLNGNSRSTFMVGDAKRIDLNPQKDNTTDSLVYLRKGIPNNWQLCVGYVINSILKSCKQRISLFKTYVQAKWPFLAASRV